MTRGVLAGLERSPRRSADGLAGEGVLKANPAPGESIEVRSEVHGVAVAPSGVPTLLIGEVEQEVWPIG